MTHPIDTLIAYIRVSTEEQANTGHSVEGQRLKVMKWRDLYHPGAMIEWFEDLGLSGMESARPGLKAALSYVDSTPGDKILVTYSLSRLSRSTRLTLWIAERLRKNDTHLVSLTEQIDTTTAAGSMVFKMLAVLAEFERDLISERTKMGMAKLRAEGKRYSRFEAYPEHIAERCAELRDKGWGWGRIATCMDKEGHETRTGCKWSRTVVKRLALKRGSEGGHLGMTYQQRLNRKL